MRVHGIVCVHSHVSVDSAAKRPRKVSVGTLCTLIDGLHLLMRLAWNGVARASIVALEVRRLWSGMPSWGMAASGVCVWSVRW